MSVSIFEKIGINRPCNECVHYFEPLLSPKNEVCKHPRFEKSYVDLVSGKIGSRNYGRFCEQQRERLFECGSIGWRFKRKERLNIVD